LDGLDSIPEEDIQLESSETSVCLTVSKATALHVLKLAKLNGEITKASFRRRKGRIIITLVKDVDTTWFDLIKKKV
jgi:hypothetical protein